MNKNKVEYDIYYLINFFIKKSLPIIFYSFILTITIFLFIFYNYFNQKLSYKQEYKLIVMPETQNELDLLRLNISEIKNNDFLIQITSRLKLQYFDYQSKRISTESFIAPTYNYEETERLFKSSYFETLYLDFFKKNKYENLKISLKKDENSETKINDVLILTVEEENLNNINFEQVVLNILIDLNKYIKFKINNEVNRAFKYYEIDKKNLLNTIINLNELTLKSTRLKILNDINNLKDELSIAEDLNLDVPYALFGLESENKKDIFDNDSENITFFNPPDIYLKGTKVLNKQINHLTNKLNDLNNMPDIYINEYFYDLIKGDFFIKPLQEKINISNVLDNNSNLINASLILPIVPVGSNYSATFWVSIFIILYIFAFILTFTFYLLKENYKSKEF